ncbi:MAG: hypothetical protein IT381_27925 [Deltaproteobacteria bacterium]|nr:hypothetical protein [Deltaproteobacteria bacterium]
MRLAPEVANTLLDLLSKTERPPMKDVLAELSKRCRVLGVSAPSRASVYNFIHKAPGRSYAIGDLPPAVRDALYNLGTGAETEVPGRQIAFYCFNYGTLPAISFAAAMPWLCLFQAARMRGFRPKARGLLAATLRARGL